MLFEEQTSSCILQYGSQTSRAIRVTTLLYAIGGANFLRYSSSNTPRYTFLWSASNEFF